jgi:hypothetical protein
MTGDPSPGARSAGRADLFWALAWIVLGAAILIESVRMDRLEKLGINPYTVPGLVPGLLGAALAILGAILLARTLLARGNRAANAAFRPNWGRFAAGALLFAIYALAMFGHLPFPLATFAFVTGFIVLAEWHDRTAAGARVRGVAFAATCGLGTAALVTYVFQFLFLVQLP